MVINVRFMEIIVRLTGNRVGSDKAQEILVRLMVTEFRLD